MDTTKKINPTLQALVIGLKLLLICAIVAGIVSFVFALTDDVYKANVAETKNRAIGSIFGLSAPKADPVSEAPEGSVYLVKDGETFVGYCVEVKSAGFGGDIQMMVGYDAAGRILGVNIVSMSETPGVGTKVGESGFLSGFVGKTDGGDVDTISGATVSSTAVINGIDRASELLKQTVLTNGGGEN